MKVIDFCNDSYFLDVSTEEIDYTWVPFSRPLHPIVPPRPRRSWLRALTLLVKARFGAFDWVLLPPVHVDFFDNPWHLQAIKRTLSWMSRSSVLMRLAYYLVFAGKCRYAILDMSDYEVSIGKEMAKISGTRIYFKRNLNADYANSVIPEMEWHPLPMIFPDAWIDRWDPHNQSPKKHFFSAGVYNTPLRKNLLETGKLLEKKNLPVDLLETNATMEEYWQRISTAHFCAAVQGKGYHTWRMYEAASIGAIPVVNPPPIGIWHWFQDGVNCLYARETPAETAIEIERLCQQPERLREMKSAAIMNVNEYNRASTAGLRILQLLKKQMLK